MKPLPLGEAALDDTTLLLEEREAVRRAFDRSNLGFLGRLLLFFGVAATIYGFGFLSTSRFTTAAVAALNALACLLLARRRESEAVAGKPRSVLAVVLLGQYLLFVAYAAGNVEGITPWAVVLPFALLFVRFEFSEQLILATAMVGLTALVPVIGPLLAAGGEASSRLALLEVLIPHASVVVACVIAGWFLTRRHRRRFLHRWYGERDRHRDRLRMKQELEHARDIQLSMLPREVPATDWLDVASLSLPATEVGGDYYDYFEVDRERLTVVVADVAGHGVASGLVLSGVRAGLNMLEGELAAPVETLSRLNRMLVRTSPRKMLVTMLVCLFDRRARQVRVASAGSPPPLHWSVSERRLREVTSGSLPLGVRSDVDYAETALDLRPGDTLLLCSDGIAETVDESGEPFGYERLAAAFADAAHRTSARGVRDALLEAVWTFKGHASQIDDVTMVVVRLT